MKLNWKFLGQGGFKQKTSNGRGMDIFWNHTADKCVYMYNKIIYIYFLWCLKGETLNYKIAQNEADLKCHIASDGHTALTKEEAKTTSDFKLS